jgi:hypothetical protein
VQRAREGPSAIELGEGDVVDPDHDDVVRGRLGPADREARVDRVELGLAKGVREIAGDADTARDDRDRDEPADAKGRGSVSPATQSSSLI